MATSTVVDADVTTRPMHELRDITRRLHALGFGRAYLYGDPTTNAVLFAVDQASALELAKAVKDGRAEALVAPERN